MSRHVEYVAHHLRITGFREALRTGRLVICDAGGCGADTVRRRASAGAAVVALSPGLECGWVAGRQSAPWNAGGDRRGVFDALVLAGPALRPVLSAEAGVLWAHEKAGAGDVLWVGSQLAADLQRFRQGDPDARPTPDDLVHWGYAGERPNYLFRAVLEAERASARPVDALLAALAAWLRSIGVSQAPVLPGGAACALVISGDTDIAAPEHYVAQRRALGDLPITYFLRAACAPSAEFLRTLNADPRVDLQLHPDALDAPMSYEPLLAEQNATFATLVGRRATAIRNHGYLNDGYWGHAAAWARESIRWSTNIPGVDGAVINGSLLPARLMLGNALTDHWSLLTPFGDGMLAALGMSGEEAAARIEAFVDEVCASGMPGVVTLNLHPANIAATGALHEALHRLVRKGALAWSLADCARWFEAAEAS